MSSSPDGPASTVEVETGTPRDRRDQRAGRDQPAGATSGRAVHAAVATAGGARPALELLAWQ
ncbi:hypothetical protein ABT008_22295 [Micromonospora sp. NPDC002389]|uniref:hypothetical protein n=1 Tax=Micromonospora sp. NPDC002389 TaxID=3154272 RepID=UPI0033339CEF